MPPAPNRPRSSGQPLPSDIPSQLAFSPEWMVNQFNGLRSYLDDKFEAIDERLRKVETAEAASRVDTIGKIANLAERVTDIEKQDLGNRMAKVEPVTSAVKWLIGAVAAFVVTLIWGILTHTVLITYITGSRP